MGQIELRGARVVLRAFRPEEIALVWEARKRAALMGQPLGPGTRSRLRRRLARSGAFHDGWLDLAIEVEGRLVGEIDARCPPRSMPPGVFELGITLFELADRGKGYGSEAIELLTGYLFEDADAERVQASTALTNRAMRRVLEKLGFAEEGILRGFMPGADGRRDNYAMYAVTKADWVSAHAAGVPR